jgi:hypothetical protein
LDEALALLALHGPPRCALGQRRGDGIIDCISKDDLSLAALGSEWLGLAVRPSGCDGGSGKAARHSR